MLDREDIIGQNIICNGSGIGQIVDVTALHEGGDEFYKVVFPKDKCINYFSVNNSSTYRILSSKEKINKAIDKFNTIFESIEYGTTQNKISVQKEMLKQDDVCDLAKSLSILNNDKELHSQVSKFYKESLASFVDEIMFVLDLKIDEAYALLGIKAPNKK